MPAPTPPVALIPKTEAMRLGNLVATALLKHAAWSAALDGASPLDSVLVRRVDRADQFYHVVTLGQRERASARMAINARTGALLRCHGISTREGMLTRWLPPFDVLKAREGRRLSPHAGCESLLVRMASATILPTLVWRPCAVSVTPLLPFHVVVIGDTLAYIRVDGRVYAELPPQLPGR